MNRIIITGGHLTPAQAVISELHKRGGWEIYYFGRKYAMEGEKTLSAESKIIPGLGVKFIPIAAGRLQRKFTRYTFPSLLRTPIGFLQSFLLLLKIKPDIILSFGGYVSVPIVISGYLLRVPILAHEQTVVFGLSSRINSFFAAKIAVSFPQGLSYFPKNKAILTGNPIRKEIFEINKPLIAADRVRPCQPIIYVTGGNQGAHLINMALLEILPELLKKYVVIHQTGEKDFEDIRNRELGISAVEKKNYFAFPYIRPEEMGWVLNKADLVISRAGANTISELAALGKPSILIPIPWTYQDEQTQNAKILVEAGIAELLRQDELTGETLLEKIKLMMGNLEHYRKNAGKSKEFVRLDAAEKIVDLVESLIIIR